MAALPEVEKLGIGVGISPDVKPVGPQEPSLIKVGDAQRVGELEGELAGVLKPVEEAVPQIVEHEGEPIVFPVHPDAEGNITIDFTEKELKEERKFSITEAHKWIAEFVARKVKMALFHGKRVIFKPSENVQ